MTLINNYKAKRAFMLLLTLCTTCVTFIWPSTLAQDRALAATNKSFDVKPNNQSTSNTLVQTPKSGKTVQTTFQFNGHAYRAYHSISTYEPAKHSWVSITRDLTEDTNPSSDGYTVDQVTAVAPGSAMWYVGTLIGQVVEGMPSSGWTRSSSNQLPERTVTAVAQVPEGNGEVAAVGYGGYNSATPEHQGHVFVTLDGGTRWYNISGALPDAPVQHLKFIPASGQWVLQAEVAKQWYQTSESGTWQRL